MLSTTLKTIALGLVLAVVAAPVAQSSRSARLSPEQVARLGAKTEAAGFAAISRYLVARSAESLSAGQVARLGAQTEAAERATR